MGHQSLITGPITLQEEEDRALSLGHRTQDMMQPERTCQPEADPHPGLVCWSPDLRIPSLQHRTKYTFVVSAMWSAVSLTVAKPDRDSGIRGVTQYVTLEGCLLRYCSALETHPSPVHMSTALLTAEQCPGRNTAVCLTTYPLEDMCVASSLGLW